MLDETCSVSTRRVGTSLDLLGRRIVRAVVWAIYLVEDPTLAVSSIMARIAGKR